MDIIFIHSGNHDEHAKITKSEKYLVIE